MGIVFENQKPFNSYPEKYSWDNWNQAVANNSNDPGEMKTLTHLVKGNFYALMNHLLEFQPNPETCHPWVPKRPTFKK